MKSRPRTPIKISFDILYTIYKNGGKARPTRILYRANLSYERMQRYLKTLIEKGLIKEERNRHTYYTLTERGLEFISEFMKMERLVEAFGFEI